MTVDALRVAYYALTDGDVEPLVSFIDPSMKWRGRRRLRQFFHPPSWRGPDEAREVLADGIAHRRLRGDRDYRVDSVEYRHDHVVVSFSWVDEEGQRHAWAQALRLKDGKIVGIQDFANPRNALTLMRLRSTFGWA